MILLLGATFIFTTIHYPNTTGWIGYWLIEVVAKNLLGKTVLYLPYAIGIPGLSLCFYQNRIRTIVSTCILNYITLSIYIEQLKYPNGIDQLTAPIMLDGGGYIGRLGLYVLNSLIGINGTKIIIYGIFFIATILIINL